MKNLPPTEGQPASDKEVLHQFGYAQQLLRDMGGFSNFAISFSINSILTGAVTLYGVGLNAGGPVVMGIGWPLVTLFVLFVSAAIAGIDYGCAQFMAPLIGLPDSPGSYLAVFGCLLLSHAILNHVGIRTVARLNDFSAIYHIAGVAVVVLALAIFAPKQPITFLFTKTFTTIKDQPYWFAFLGGLLQAQWTYTGYDASAHTIEETRNARVSAPWGIYLSVAISGFFGYVMLLFVTLAIKDLAATASASNPFI